MLTAQAHARPAGALLAHLPLLAATPLQTMLPQPQPQQQQTYAAMLASLPPASRTEAGNGFYQQTAASVGANSFDPSGGLGAAPGPYLPAAAQPGAWTQNGA